MPSLTNSAADAPFNAEPASPGAARGESDIAIVGMACRFPGANDYDEFWSNLVGGNNNVCEVPKERWDWKKYYGDPASGNKTNSKWGGYLDNVDRFDASFFGISPREAICMDPQQRIMLELAWQCIEDAGRKPKDLAGKEIGVFVAASNMEYKTLRERSSPSLEGHHGTGLAMTIIPNRISFFFDFRGPSIVLDTACSGSLVAIQAAVNSLRNGECEGALVGGVSILAAPDTYLAFGKVGMLSSTGACHSFEDTADGYVRGEGGGMVFLKPLATAIADGDQILGVVKGVAVNHGGRARSLTAPNVRSQSKVIVNALRQAGVSPATINYIEAHGTGTPLGDPIEIHGLVRAFSQTTPKGETLGSAYCALGAVKSNIGHLESASGIASVIKVLLALRFKTIPGNFNFTRLNSRIDFAGTPFYVAEKLEEWQRLTAADGTGMPLRAGVSCFGFGGVNSHLVIEEAPAAAAAIATAPAPAHVLTLSAASETSLLGLMQRYVTLLAKPGCDLAALCRRANTARELHPLRVATTGASAQQLSAGLEAQIAVRSKLKPPGFGAAAAKCDAPVVGFMFTGQGAQHVGMGRDLFDNHPVFREAFEACDRLLQPLLGVSLIDIAFSGANGDLNETKFTQPALFAFEYALVQMWQAHGVKPAAVIGHSVGEIVAACVAGGLTLEGAVALIAARARLMDALPATGAMATIHGDEKEVRQWLGELGLPIDLAAVNAPQSTVVSGLAPAIDEIVAYAQQRGIQASKLHVVQGFHSRLMDPVLAPFLDAIGAIPMKDPQLAYFSNVSGAALLAGQLTPAYWVDHIRQPVLFSAGIGQMRQSGVNLFLEIGPAAVLTSLGRRSCGGELDWVPSMQREGSSFQHVLAGLCELFRLGVEVDFRPLYAGQAQSFVQLPPYPFGGKSYWYQDPSNGRPDSGLPGLLGPAQEPLLGNKLHLANASEHVYMASYPDHALDYLEEHRVAGTAVMPAAGYVTMALSALTQSGLGDAGRGPLGVSGLKLHNLLRLNHRVSIQTILKKPAGASADAGFEIWFADQYGQASQEDAAPAWILAASGQAGGRPVPAREFAVEAGIDSAARTIDIDRMYTDMAGRGLDYGVAFRAVRSVSVRGDVADAHVLMHPSVAHGAAALVNAALLDAVFQTAYPLLAGHAGDPAQVYVPASVDEIVVSRRLPDSFRVQARLATDGLAAATLRCDFLLFDTDGLVIGAVNGLNLRLLSLAAAGADAAAPGDAGDWLYQPDWTICDAPAVAHTGVQGTTMILYSAEGRALAEATAAGIGIDIAGAATTVCVDFDPRNPSDPAPPAYYQTLDPAQPASFSALLAQYPHIDTIFFFGALGAPDQVQAEAGMARGKRVGEVALFNLLKALTASADGERPLRLKVMSNYSQAVLAGQKLMPWGAGAPALAAVFCRENAHVELVNIDLDLDEGGNVAGQKMAATAARIIAEVAVQASRSCAYRGAASYHRGFAQMAAGAAGAAGAAEASGFKQGGVYLILGGAGGIGLRLSQYLVEKYAASVVLVGRSALSEQKGRELALPADSKGAIVYVQADGADVAAMSEVVAMTRQRFGRVDGAVHSAVVLRDSLLANMDAAAFAEALAPKIDASWALYQALRGEALDFLMFFSSAVSLAPTVGQANYVAACAFQDAFAAWLRSQCNFPVKVVNWGRWGEVGVATTSKYSQHFDAQGVFPIDPADGLAAIDAMLRSPAQQVLAIKASPASLAVIGVSAALLERRGLAAAAPGRGSTAGSGASKLSASDIEALADTGDQPALQAALYAYLIEELREVLRVGPGVFDPAQDDLRGSYLSELGMDSLTAVDLRSRLRKQLQVDIPIEFLLGGARIQAVFDNIYEQVLLRRLMNVGLGDDAQASDENGEVEEMDTLVI